MEQDAEPPDVALVSPSHRGDLARCELMCETVDRHVTGWSTHHLLVNHGDVGAFAHLRTERRRVSSVHDLLPWWLPALPFAVRRKRRTVFPSLRTKPLRGWHVQQLVKLAAASTLGHDAVVNVDCDVFFVRPFDVRTVATPPTPVTADPGRIDGTLPDHERWLATAHRLLGLDPPTIPADDHIDSIVTWRADTVRDLLARIERTSGAPWALTLARTREFSEYLLYGTHVRTDPVAAALHRLTAESYSRSHWDGDALDAAGLAALVAAVEPPEVAVHVQGFGDTPLALIRDALAAYR